MMVPSDARRIAWPICPGMESRSTVPFEEACRGTSPLIFTLETHPRTAIEGAPTAMALASDGSCDVADSAIVMTR